MAMSFEAEMSGNGTLQMKKKDVKTSQKLSRSRLESPVVDRDSSRSVPVSSLVSLFVAQSYNDCTIVVELYKQRHIGMGRLQ